MTKSKLVVFSSRTICLFYCLLVWPIFSAAGELRFSQINRSDGLSQGTVNALAQDQYGLVWIGTDDGLYRYDGNRLLSYRHDPDVIGSIPDNVITALGADAAGRVWVGSESDGVSYYNYHNDQFIHIDTDSVGQTIRNIFANKNKRSAIIKSQPGLFRVSDQDQVSKLLTAEQSSDVILAKEHDNFVTTIHTTGKALTVSLKDNTVSTRSIIDAEITKAWSISSCDFLFLSADKNKAHAPTLYCYNNTQLQISELHRSLSSAGLDLAKTTISDIKEDDNGTIWIATLNGLLKYSDQKLTSSNHLPYDEHSLSSNKLTTLLADKNTLFIGTEYDGLNTLDTSNQFAYFNLLNSQHAFTSNITPGTKNESCGQANAVDYDTVWAILKDSEGDLWVGNDHGLALQNGGTTTFTDFSRLENTEKHLDLCSVWSLAETDGVIWIGIWGGLISLDKASGEFHHYKPGPNTDQQNTLSGKFVRVLLHDKIRNSLWIGTNRKGLNKLDLSTKEIVKYPFSATNKEMIPHGRIRSLYLDQSNQLWVGSGGGLSLYNDTNNTFRTLTSSTAATDLSDEDVRAINQHTSNTYWIGTGNGINLFNSETFQVESRINESHGLSNSTVYAMVPDNSGHYWITTANGLSKFNPDTLEFVNYNAHHGLQSNEFNFNAWHKNNDGSIYVGGISGLNVISPDSATRKRHVYPPILTSIVGTDKDGNQKKFTTDPTTPATRKIDAPYRNLEFFYSFPSYGDPGLAYSQYQLSRNAVSWSAPEPLSHIATYTNIKPGNHLFQIRSNNDSADPAQFELYIAPRFWETLWFKTLLVLTSLALLAVAIVKYNRHQLKSGLEAFTQQHYRILEHELRPHLHQANANINKFRELPDLQPPQVDFIDTSIKPLMEKSISFLSDARQMIDFEKAVAQPTKEYMLEDVVDDVLLLFTDQQHQILVEPVEDVNICTHQDAVYLLISNLVSNALKYSPDESKVHLKISTNNQNLIVQCKDTGMGINEDKRSAIYRPYTRLTPENSNITGLGLGLSIIKNIAQTYKGDIQIHNNQPTGSIFIVTLKGIVTLA